MDFRGRFFQVGACAPQLVRVAGKGDKENMMITDENHRSERDSNIEADLGSPENLDGASGREASPTEPEGARFECSAPMEANSCSSRSEDRGVSEGEKEVHPLAGKGCTSLSASELVALDTDNLWNLYLDARERQDEEGKTQVRNALMEKYLPLVRVIALKLLRTMPSSVELDDLVSPGVFGLMDAIGRFDPDRGVRFKSYCSTRIRGSILDQLRSEDWVPRQVRLQASKIDRALKDLGEEYGREPTEGELATRLDCDEAELRRRLARSAAARMVSLSGKWSGQDGSGEQMAHTLQNEKAIEPREVLNEADVLSFITRSLTERERFIILQYYKAGQTMREIGEILQLTESRVCQIHSNVMVRLRSIIDPEQVRILLSA